MSRSSSDLVRRPQHFSNETHEKSSFALKAKSARALLAGKSSAFWIAWALSASRFPCGYDIYVILVFGQDERLRERYIIGFQSVLDQTRG
jgi:hypothetical protein